MDEQERIRAAVEVGMCPWCGRGPYIVLAGHTTRVHDIDRIELRELAGLTYSASVCDPGHSADCAERAKARPFPPRDRPKGEKRNVSPAGRASAWERLASWQAKVGPDEVTRQKKAAASAAARSAGARMGLRKANEMARKVPVSEYPNILRLYDEEGMRQVDIAARYGVTQVNISSILRKIQPNPTVNRRLRGAAMRRKIQPSDYPTVVRMYEVEHLTQNAIAEFFGTSQTRISQIVKAQRATQIASR